MIDKLMYIPDDDTQIAPSVENNLWLKRQDTQLNNPINQINKLLSQRITKRYCKTFGTSVINIPMSPPALHEDTVDNTTQH